MKPNFTKILIFGWLSIISVCLYLRVEPNIVWSGDTFIGVFVAAIGIAVAFIVGYQIYNAVDIKTDLRNMRNEIQSITDRVNASLSENTVSNRDF